MIQVTDGIQQVASFMEVVWRVDVSPQMAAPTGAAVQSVFDLTDNEAVTSTIIPSGSASIEDDVYVKLPLAKDFEANHQYSIRFSFTDGTNVLPGEIRAKCEF